MKFFMISAGVIVLLIIILLIGFLFIVDRFKPSNCKRKYQFFLPTIVGLLLTIVIVMSVPIGLDAIDMLAKKTETQNILVSELQTFSKLKTKDGRIYKYSSFEERPLEGQEYQVKICKRTNFIYHFSKVENVQ
ncbi:hypothetical protein [Fastidiosipila sanguinis]|uniref:DUF3290 domain-containing protein n=1 Tax=Fastidiosipila sanguinis TaxID=236753 RepID=A0A2S0KM23_9FIRM|nr:hypothetical protein [Fastidiosipila sanguinis]AVM42068.1 hypothetical protein C5Q98_01945 [Fastidiosipila sanguinis]